VLHRLVGELNSLITVLSGLLGVLEGRLRMSVRARLGFVCSGALVRGIFGLVRGTDFEFVGTLQCFGSIQRMFERLLRMSRGLSSKALRLNTQSYGILCLLSRTLLSSHRFKR